MIRIWNLFQLLDSGAWTGGVFGIPKSDEIRVARGSSWDPPGDARQGSVLAVVLEFKEL